MRWTAPLFVALSATSYAQTPSAPTMMSIDGGTVQQPPSPPAAPPPTSGNGDNNLSNGENRCDELGSACRGTLSFQATAYSATGDLNGGMFAENPRVNTSKIIRPGYSSAYANSATFYNASGASGFSVQTNCYTGAPSSVRCVRAAQGVGVMNTEDTNWSSYTGRVGARMYFRLNPGWQSTNEGGCTNDKYMQLADYVSGFGSNFGASTGGSFSPPIKPDDVEGSWVRLESYIDDWDNPTRYTVYMTNLTTGVTHTLSAPVSVAKTPAYRESLFPFHLYRAGSCSGTRDVMFLMMAHWPNPSGNERIKGAPEVEGSNYLN